jgi:hypothetical protein
MEGTAKWWTGRGLWFRDIGVDEVLAKGMTRRILLVNAPVSLWCSHFVAVQGSRANGGKVDAPVQAWNISSWG